MKTPFGYFSNDGREFLINTPDIPRNWYNYFHTDHYITYTSQVGTGSGFLQDDMGRRYSPVCGRGVYIHDGERGWSLTGLPIHEPREEYQCIHGIGYTVITLKKHGIKTEYGLFVPTEDSPTTGYEVLWVKVTNESEAIRTCKVMAYSENEVDDAYKPQGYNTAAVFKDDTVNGLHYVNTKNWNGKSTAFEIFLTCGQELSGYDLARNAFIGTYGSLSDPLALHRGECSNSSCVAEKCGYALERTVILQPGESDFCSFAMGMTESIERVNGITEGIATEEGVKALLAEVKEHYAAKARGIEIDTPDRELNFLFNHWLKYQTEMGSRWARVRHNGYRDIASDTECLSCYRPKLAWERVKRILSYQYANGYAPRTFIDGQLFDHNYSDCTVWLTFTVYAILCELGDLSLLEELVPFNNGETASVYEHLRRSVDFLYNFRGHYGLIQIWGGDWNDGMNCAGLEHKGVSIWLTMAWYRANKQFAEISRWLGKEEEALIADERGREMQELVDCYGWDTEGGYYRYAYSDDEHHIGASDCEEGSIYLNPQLWAVLSGIAVGGKEILAMNAAEEKLSYELGTAVSTPPYTRYMEYIGAISRKAPGVQENGGVYLHPMCWKLAVDALLGREDRVKYDLECILPFRNPIVAGRAEPYVICNCYFGKEADYRYGTPGQSWRTASGQWLLYALARFVFGITPRPEGLIINPCLPADWNGANVTRIFRDCVYRITYKRVGKRALFVNGASLNFGSILPYEPHGEFEVTVEF